MRIPTFIVYRANYWENSFKIKGMKKFIRRLGEKIVFGLYPDLGYLYEKAIPKGLETKDLLSRVPADFFGLDGIELNLPDQIERLKRWRSSYQGFFKDLRGDPAINTGAFGKGHISNPFYQTPDAEVYAAMILDHKPKTIIEIGSGFSTIIARKTAAELNNDCKIVIVDPEPRTDIKKFAESIFYKRVEDLEPDKIIPAEKAVFFIDSSHITRPGGDIPCLYNKILPNLPSGTPVHVHDIFIPYDYPYQFQKRLYTEQYVLHALLADSSRYKVVFATHYMSRHCPEEMRTAFSEVVGKEDAYYGESFWFEVI